MRQRNWPLVIGSVLGCGIILLALVGPWFAPHDPMQTFRVMRWNDTTYGGPPLRALPPFTHPDHPLGMDRVGRDVLSRLLWAVRPTLIFCLLGATIRVLLGVVIGVISGAVGRKTASVLDTLVSLGGAIPMLLIAIAVILFRPDQAGLGTFLIAVTLTGWLPTAVLVQNRVHVVLKAPFIESARAIGLSSARIFRVHVLPQVVPLLPLLLAAELSAITLLITELGYLGLYIGGAFVYTSFVGDTPIPDYLIPASNSPELGQMLADFFGQINRTPWVLIAAGVLIIWMLCSWTLLSEGLRRELDLTRPRRRWRRQP